MLSPETDTVFYSSSAVGEEGKWIVAYEKFVVGQKAIMFQLSINRFSKRQFMLLLFGFCNYFL